MASDDFLPHQFKDKGYRLVHSNGILILTAAASVLIVLFRGQTSALIPLYALGVFMSFTLSQAGMVIHWFKNQDDPKWRISALINTVGSITTGIVFCIIAIAKVGEGAWIVMILVPVMVVYFYWVKRRYDAVHEQLRLPAEELVDLNWQSYNKLDNHVIVLVKSIDRRLVRALQYAKTIRAESVEAIFVDATGEEGPAMLKTWTDAGLGIRLTIIQSPYREVVGPVIKYVRDFPRETRDDIVTVIVPEYAPMDAADAILHDQTSFWIKQQLFGEEGVIVADVPYHPSFDEIRSQRPVNAPKPVQPPAE
jgi:hypothetical protein